MASQQIGKYKTPLFIIFTTVFLDLVGFGVVIPLISVYGRHYGASPGQLAVLGAGYSVMQFFFAPLWGALSDKVGRRPILLLSLCGSTSSYILFGFAKSFEVLLISRVLAGVFAANISAAQAYISDITPPEKRASGMGMIGAAFGLGFILGPPLGGVASALWGLPAPGIIAGVICGLNLILAWFRLPESLPVEKRSLRASRSLLALAPSNIAEILKQPVLAALMLIFFFTTFAFAHLEQCFSLLFQQKFFPETTTASLHTGAMLGWSGILGALVQGGLIRKLENKFNLWNLLFFGLATSAVTYALFPYVPYYPWYFIISVPLAFAGGLINPSVSALISRHSPANEQGSSFGVSQGLGSLARALAPLSAQLTFAWYYALPFLIAGIVSLAMCVICMQVKPAKS